MRAFFRDARRVWVVAAAALAVVGLLYWFVSGVARSDGLESRVRTLETQSREAFGRAWKMDAKLDLVMGRLGMPVPEHLRAGDAPPVFPASGAAEPGEASDE